MVQAILEFHVVPYIPGQEDDVELPAGIAIAD
jgi:hypothetical protein